MNVLRVLFAVAAITALTAMTAMSAEARCATPRVDRRELRQHARIQQGVRRGELTRGEAWRLRAGQGQVRRMEQRAKSDGRVTPRERMRLDRAQDRQSRRIFRLKHNHREI